MFGGLKRSFKDLRYGDPNRRRKIFWFSTIILFIIIMAIWIVFFSGNFLKIKDSSFSSYTGGINSLWQSTKGQFDSITSQVEGLGGQLFAPTSTENTTSTQGTSTNQ